MNQLKMLLQHNITMHMLTVLFLSYFIFTSSLAAVMLYNGGTDDSVAAILSSFKYNGEQSIRKEHKGWKRDRFIKHFL